MSRGRLHRGPGPLPRALKSLRQANDPVSRPGHLDRSAPGARRVMALSFLVFMAALPQARAETTAAPPAKPQAAPEPNPDRPEYRARALPKDSFNPSEQVQEDQPVPFPEDV